MQNFPLNVYNPFQVSLGQSARHGRQCEACIQKASRALQEVERRCQTSQLSIQVVHHLTSVQAGCHAPAAPAQPPAQGCSLNLIR